jgi:hypothetical protein
MSTRSRLGLSQSIFIGLSAGLILIGTFGCSRSGYDPEKITHRPRIFLDGGSPMPILDEYDIAGIKLGSFRDIFSEDSDKRMYGLWVGVDRRAAMILQKETSRHIGRNLNFVVNGVLVGFHPIESTITNGFIPFMFTNQRSEEAVVAFYNKLDSSIQHIRLELQESRN